MTAETFFRVNRIWWSVALFVGPIAGALAGSVLIGLAASVLLVVAGVLVFDTGRPWWSDEVERLSRDPQRSRRETRSLTLWSIVALAIGAGVAGLRPWQLLS